VKNRFCSLFLMIVMLSGCSYVSQGVIVATDRYAENIPKDLFGDGTQEVVYLEQNWDRYDSLWFYNTTQGSNLLPYDIFLNMEQATNQELFRNPDQMRKFRFLTQRVSFDNPDGLPVGFVKDTYQDKDYFGFTCAACHTTQVNYKGTGIRIDGGGSLADMEGLLLSVGVALQATLDQEDKFDRLSKRILRKEYPLKKEAFRADLALLLQQHQAYNDSNTPRHGDKVVHYGYGRLDAFGRIYNRILSQLTPDLPATDNANPSNAPVSYPFLWDIAQHDYVQWNGVASNHGDSLAGFLGPLGRNVGEVLGVFGTFNLQRKHDDVGYRSSSDIRNITRLERQVARLESPQWPEEILPKIDRPLAEAGRKVFYEYKCSLCHGDPSTFDPRDPKRKVIAQFFSPDILGTDPFMADNGIDARGKSGFFKGKQLPGELPNSSKKFGETTDAFSALSRAVTYVILEPDHDKGFIRRWSERLYDLVGSFASNPIKKQVKERHVNFKTITGDQMSAPKMLRVYKGRTLNGIWATAPYLHNGSVPNLYELFLPRCTDEEIAAGKACRSRQFTVGNREFDPKRVGFVTMTPAEHPELFVFDTALPSNSNAGHEYSSGVTPLIKLNERGEAICNAQGVCEREFLLPMDEQKRIALIEYLKTL